MSPTEIAEIAAARIQFLTFDPRVDTEDSAR